MYKHIDESKESKTEQMLPGQMGPGQLSSNIKKPESVSFIHSFFLSFFLSFLSNFPQQRKARASVPKR